MAQWEDRIRLTLDLLINNLLASQLNNRDFENDLYRDFTYIDDIVVGIERLIGNPPIEDGKAPHKVFNIGNNSPKKLMVFIGAFEKALGTATGKEVEFEKVFEPIKSGDVPATYASTRLLQDAVGFKPETSIVEGLQEFVEWYVEYYGKKKWDRKVPKYFWKLT